MARLLATALTDDLDGRLTQDLVVEWCLRHGQPVHLVLTGTAGGTYLAGSCGDDADVPTLTMDAVDFVRGLAGVVLTGQCRTHPCSPPKPCSDTVTSA